MVIDQKNLDLAIVFNELGSIALFVADAAVRHHLLIRLFEVFGRIGRPVGHDFAGDWV